MLDPKVFEEISGRLSALIAASPAADIEKNARALLSGFFARLDLVSREEFDIQRDLLRELSARVEALEVAALRGDGDGAGAGDADRSDAAPAGRSGDDAPAGPGGEPPSGGAGFYPGVGGT